MRKSTVLLDGKYWIVHWGGEGEVITQKWSTVLYEHILLVLNEVKFEFNAGGAVYYAVLKGVLTFESVDCKS